MKKIILACLVLLPITAFTQKAGAQTAKDFFSSPATPALFLGVDFSRAVLIDDANGNARDIVDRQYTGINELLVTEVKKYDVKEAFHRTSDMDHDLGAVEKRGAQVNPGTLKSTNTADFHRFTVDSVHGVLAHFDYGAKKGLGILFVVEAMSKSDKAMALWVTLVDMSSGKVLFTERMEGKTSSSFGFRNYWASALKSVIDEIKKKKYDEWKSKYGG
jgi:hypothetical protein